MSLSRSKPIPRSTKPLARTPFKSKAATSKAPAKPRTRKCAVKTCRQPFVPRSITHKACGPECSVLLVEQEKASKLRKERQEGLAKLKTKRDWLREVQVVFNQFIRLRDRLAGHACISSGRPLDWSGNAVDAGHYRSVGSAPHLRFNELNCHAQSKHDNQYKSGNAADYRLGLIQRIGLLSVELLEADNTSRHYTIDELKAMKADYQRRVREMRKELP